MKFLRPLLQILVLDTVLTACDIAYVLVTQNGVSIQVAIFLFVLIFFTYGLGAALSLWAIYRVGSFAFRKLKAANKVEAV